jgi:AcrR family transcriptional regulator
MERAHITRVPKQARGILTREKLMNAAKSEFSGAGYQGTTAKSIAQAAGVAVGTFYQYFPDKDSALRELGRSRFESVTQVVLAKLIEPNGSLGTTTPSDRASRLLQLRAVVHMVVEYHREDPGLHAVLSERRHVDSELDEMTSEAERQLATQIVRLLEQWQHPGDHEAIAFVLFGMLEGAVHTHVLDRPLVSDQRFIDALVFALSQVALPESSTP